jgi:hypothetical protein
MPDLNEFFNKPDEKNNEPYELEKIPGIRPCSKCDEDVNEAFWDPIDMVMSWRCSKGHETIFKVG